MGNVRPAPHIEVSLKDRRDQLCVDTFQCVRKEAYMDGRIPDDPDVEMDAFKGLESIWRLFTELDTPPPTRKSSDIKRCFAT
jgi:hypothetical protein